MENSNQAPKNHDEIDLGKFVEAIGQAFNSFGRAILYFLASLRNLLFQNRLFFAGIVVLGIGLGAVYSELLKKDYYKSTMVLSCDYLNTQILNNTIHKFNLLCSEPEREGLAELLKIDQATAKNIQAFEFEPFVSEDDVVEMEILKTQLNNNVGDKKDLVEKIITKLEIQNKNAYEISVRVYHPDIVKPLEKALVDYFQQNSYISKRIKVNTATLNSRKVKLEAESKKLDSLKSVLYKNYLSQSKNGRGSNNVIFGDEQIATPLEIFTKDLELNYEILNIDKALYIKPDFEVIDGFTSFKEPESASLFRILIIAFFASIIIGYIIIGAWKFDAMLAKIDTKSK